MGGSVMSGMSMQQVPQHPLIEELSKQYDVEEVDLNSPVSGDVYAALVCVQPSSLAPPQFERLLEAVRNGIPVAVFEDPAPVGAGYITPTGEPKQSQASMFGGGGPTPKADIRALWDVLELDVPGKPGMQGMYSPDLVWQQHNPYPTLDDQSNELWIFIDEDSPGAEPGQALSADNPITSGMQEVLAIVSGAVNAKSGGKLSHTPLLQTGAASGLIAGSKMQEIMRGQTTVARETQGIRPSIPIAMAIMGPEPELQADAAEKKEGEEAPASTPPVKAVYVADTDMMLPEFLMIRADPNVVTEARFQFQNVTFVLNCIDWLTGNYDFIEVRKHEPIFASLRMIDSVKEQARSEVREGSKAFQDQYLAEIRDAEEAQQSRLKELSEEVEKLQQKNADGNVSRAELQAKLQTFQTQQELEQRKLDVRRTKLERDRELKVRDIDRTATDKVTKIQNKVKAFAVTLPCIPPLVVGVIVFASRRLRERENISKSRLK
jgi:ABC-2 type transport system permease protein